MNDAGTPARRVAPFLGLNRPQYAALPELLVSALAWSAVERSGHQLDMPEIEGRHVNALAFDVDNSGGRGPTALQVGRTCPQKNSPRWLSLVSVLARDLNLDPGTAERVADVVLSDLKALRPPKAKSVAATPLNIAAGLLQDVKGLARVANPPNYAAIIERMYRLGGGEGPAAARLAIALADDRGGNPVWLRDAIGEISPPELHEAAAAAIRWARTGDFESGSLSPAWIRGRRTPYAWFAAAWDALTKGEWIDAMPRRRWVDWCACVLRTALGAGYLYEMNLVYRMAAAVGSDEPEGDVVRQALALDGPLLAWDERARPSSRDVRGHVRLIAQRGTACLELVGNWLSRPQDPVPDPADFAGEEEGLEHWLREARRWRGSRGASTVRSEIAAALDVGHVPTPAKNVDETIMYSLVARADRPGAADLYGLLRRRGRYTVVDPGQEWFVAVASLCARRAGGDARVADVEEALREIGLRPGFPAIVARLEVSGLARSSHDADEAIELRAAF